MRGPTAGIDPERRVDERVILRRGRGIEPDRAKPFNRAKRHVCSTHGRRHPRRSRRRSRAGRRPESPRATCGADQKCSTGGGRFALRPANGLCFFLFDPPAHDDDDRCPWLRDVGPRDRPPSRCRSAMLRSVNVCGPTLPRVDLLPRARRRDRRAGFGPHRVGRRERRAVAVAAGVDVDAPAAIGLAELLREVRRDRARPAARPTACANRATSPNRRLAVERDDDVKALRAGCLHPARQAELGEQIAQRRAPRRAARRARRPTDRDRRRRCRG